MLRSFRGGQTRAGRGWGQLTPSRWRRASARGRGPCARPTSSRAPRWDRARKRDERRAKRDCVGRVSRSVFHAPRVRGVEARPPVPAVRVPGPARRPKAHLPERIRHRARDAAPRPTAGKARHLERLRRFATTKSRGRRVGWHFFVRALSLRFWVGVVDVDFFICTLDRKKRPETAVAPSTRRRLFFEPGFGDCGGILDLCRRRSRATRRCDDARCSRPRVRRGRLTTGGDLSRGAETRGGVTRRRVCVLRPRTDLRISAPVRPIAPSIGGDDPRERTNRIPNRRVILGRWATRLRSSRSSRSA